MTRLEEAKRGLNKLHQEKYGTDICKKDSCPMCGEFKDILKKALEKDKD